VIVVDTSGVFAALNPDQPEHVDAREALETAPPPHVLSPFVLAELDYLLLTRGGVKPALAFLNEVADESYLLASFDAADVVAAADVLERYADIRVGLTDASIVVLADRYGTDRVLTLDERHFRTLRRLGGGRFTLLPADARKHQLDE
jgi:predicted nucleic acid-binding protein